MGTIALAIIAFFFFLICLYEVVMRSKQVGGERALRQMQRRERMRLRELQDVPEPADSTNLTQEMDGTFALKMARKYHRGW